MTEQEQLEIVKRQPAAISEIANPSLAAQTAALTYSGTLIHSIRNIDPRVFDDPEVIHSLELSLLFALKHGYTRSLKDMITTVRSTGASWDTLNKVENAMTRTNIQENTQIPLTEELGNLAELRLGKLGDLLKQQFYYAWGRRQEPYMGATANKFMVHTVGTNSEIITVPAVKRDLAKTIKKQFTADSEIVAAAVYLNNSPVLFMITDAENLRGGKRPNSVAYDFTVYSEDFQEIMKDKTYDYRSYPATSVRQETETDYSVSNTRDFPLVTKNYAGKNITTYDLGILLSTVEAIAKQQNITVSLKFVKRDQARMKVRLSRQNISRGDVLITGEELKVRLAKYKNSKRPTAETIEDFIQMSISGTADVIRFDNVAYRVAKSSYDKIDPVLLLQGKPFSVSYSGADPGDYRSIDVRFYFDRTSNMIVPYVARWYIDQKRQEEILDPAAYLKVNLNISTVEKREVLKKILENLKAGRVDSVKSYIRAVKKMNVDWPEIAQIEAVLERGKLTESRDYNSMSEEEQVKIVYRDPFKIKYIQSPSERVQLEAVNRDGYAVIYIRNPSLRVQKAAILDYKWAAMNSNISDELFDDNDVKQSVLLKLLKDLKDGDEYLAEYVEILRSKNVKWTELNIIESALYRTQISERKHNDRRK